MDPTATLRLRRAVATGVVAWAVAGLALSFAAQLTAPGALELPFEISVMGGAVNVYRPGPTARAEGVRRGDRIRRIDGEPALTWLRRGGFAGLEAGRANRYAITRGGAPPTHLALAPEAAAATPTMAQPLYLALLAVGLAYLGIGIGVWRLRPQRADAFALLLLCALMAAQLFVSVDAWRAWRGIERLLVTLPLLGAAFFHLFTLPPLEPAWMVRHQRARWIPYAIAGALGLAAIAGEPVGVPIEAVSMAAFFYANGLALASVAVLAATRRQRRDPVQAARADVLFVAAIVGFVPVILLLAAQVVLGVALPSEIVLLWLALFPGIVGWGMVRRELFDIRMLARSSAAYGASTLFITALFAVAVTAADTAVAGLDIQATAPWISVVFLFLAILAFNPLRGLLQGFVDRVFDRDRIAHRDAVREISEALVSTLSMPELVDRILTALTETMGVERAAVLLLDGDTGRIGMAAIRGEWDRDARALELADTHPVVERLRGRRDAVARGEFDDETDAEARDTARECFDRLDAELLVPILFGSDLLGVLVVGRKLAGERLHGDDRQLLRTLANQSAIAIENARAFDEIEALNATLEERVAARTRELADTQDQLVQSEKLKSLGRLVAGIAHELGNPIGFVHANLDLLRGALQRLLDPTLPETETARARAVIERLLARSREGTERVKHIVEDLRVFSRPDRAELQDADLNAEIDRTITLMDPRLKHGVRVVREFGALPRVRCHPGQLGQVFLNLLMNACDALGGRGEIRVRTASSPRGVRLEFEDDGPGIPDDVRAHVFDAFFTTRPAGQGTGLGLSLSRGIVERHGGTIRAETAPGGGARFVVELPLRASEGDTA